MGYDSNFAVGLRIDPVNSYSQAWVDSIVVVEAKVIGGENSALWEVIQDCEKAYAEWLAEDKSRHPFMVGLPEDHRSYPESFADYASLLERDGYNHYPTPLHPLLVAEAIMKDHKDHGVYRRTELLLQIIAQFWGTTHWTPERDDDRLMLVHWGS